MQKVTIKAYAVKHKLSIFNVMKMVKSGKLKSEIIEEEGREVTYIHLDEAIEEEVAKGIVSLDKVGEISLQQQIQSLKKELEQMRVEIEDLKKRL